MIELIRTALRDQYGAALMMTRNSIEKCTAANWTKPVGRFPFWHVAYHTLYFADFYLSPDEGTFAPQPFHREGYQRMGGPAGPTLESILSDQPYPRSNLLDYADFCMTRMVQTVMNESEEFLSSHSGFSWLQFPRVQAHLYNIRHIQHHAGQLNAFLVREQGEEKQWVRAYKPEMEK